MNHSAAGCARSSGPWGSFCPGGLILRSLFFATVLVIAATSFVHPAGATCGVITRTATVPTEGATVGATIAQCSDSYSSGTFTQQDTYNDTHVAVYDPTTGTSANADDSAQTYSSSDSAYNDSQAQRWHGYSGGVSTNGVSAYAYASESKYSYAYGSNSGCFGYVSANAYHSTPLENSNTNENVPVGDGTQLPCVSDDTENLLP